MPASESSFALFVFVAGVLALAVALTAVFEGQMWQAAVFAFGGAYVVTWSGWRLVPARADR
jgi:hypothetical protein